MISERDKNTILNIARKYSLEKIILFGSSKERKDFRDIDLAVKGLDPKVFFDFFWELYRDLSKPVDIIDLSVDCSFNRLIEKEGLVLYG